MTQRRIALIACCSTKLDRPAKARDLYVSPLFRLTLQWVEDNQFDAVHVLSALYGLIDLDDVIEPYNFTLKTASLRARTRWAERVAKGLQERGYRLHATHDQSGCDRFVFYAGTSYRFPLSAWMTDSHTPLQALRNGAQVQWLQSMLSPSRIRSTTR